MATVSGKFVHLNPFVLSNAHSIAAGRRSPFWPIASRDAEDLAIEGRIYSGRKLNVRLDASHRYVPIVNDKLVDVCTLLSKLRHPSILHFLGLSYHDGSRFPQMVYEYAPYNLALLLEVLDDIPLSVKRSILCDVANGLEYLHCQRPAVVHRNLTARSVRLNSAMIAKISDTGMIEVEGSPVDHQVSMVSPRIVLVLFVHAVLSFHGKHTRIIPT